MKYFSKRSQIAFLLLICLLIAPIVGFVAADDGPEINGKIAFATNRDGNFEIYVMNPDGSGQTRLTNNNAEDWRPSWSPNGTKIAFQSDRDGNWKIYVMNADGTGVTRLTNNNYEDACPRWSPDGTKFVFISDRNGDNEIYVMNADGMGQTRLTNNNADDWWPFWQSARASTGSGNVRVTVKDSNGIPIAGVKVLMVNMPDGQWASTGFTDALGTSIDYGLLPGDYVYEVSKAGYLTVTSNTVTVSAGITANINITLGAGTPSKGNLKIAVLDAYGLPILGALVESSIWPNGQTMLSATSESSHNFFFSNILPGRYQLKASKSFFVTARSDTVTVVAGRTTEITIVMQAQAPPTGDLKVTVIDPRSNPIVGAKVSMTSTPSGQTELSEDTGSSGIVLFPYVLPGNYSLKVQMNGFNDVVSDTLIVSTGRSTEIIITMHSNVLERFVFNSISNTQYKDVEFDIIITALDPYGETYDSYSGTNTLSGNNAQISPTSTGVFEKGVWRGKVKIGRAHV